jgi:hypothetical protein
MVSSGTAEGALRHLNDAHDAYGNGVRSRGAKSDLTSFYVMPSTRPFSHRRAAYALGPLQG